MEKSAPRRRHLPREVREQRGLYDSASLGREGPENTTIFPIPGDVCYLYFPVGYPVPKGAQDIQRKHGAIVDLAIFYGRNNLLLSPGAGYVPANVFATITEGLPKLAEACESVWREGSVGERLVFRRLE